MIGSTKIDITWPERIF